MGVAGNAYVYVSYASGLMAEASSGVDTFLSDVHIGTFGALSEKGTTTSRFVFHLPACLTTETGAQPEVDEDGDFIVSRREDGGEGHLLLIEHAMSTPLEDVGLQVWRGALLMADYLLHHGNRLCGSTVLELGAGAGLVSIVAALSADIVFCTDVGEKILDLCQLNIDRNLEEFDRRGVVHVRELDWEQPFQVAGSKYSWRPEDMKALERTDFVLATDIIYEDSITKAFFSCLVELHSRFKRTPVVLIALEKRINFTLEDLAPASSAYEHFRRFLERPYLSATGAIHFSVQQLATDFPQYFHYERVNELELWEIQVH